MQYLSAKWAVPAPTPVAAPTTRRGALAFRVPQCGEVKLPHRVCPNCGFYKNREVIETE